MNYYNEHDTKAAAWLRALIAAGEIPNGVVDERSIVEINATELTEYAQCHFFAGIGGWSLALKLAGWPSDKPVWTGSCHCQPFSTAGQGKGQSDERHLWPAFFRLIRECRPDVVFGEQVASAIGHGWLDGIHADLEGENYAVGHCVLGAHSVGAPHIRQRLYWLADAAHPNGRGGICGAQAGVGQDGTGRERPSSGGADGGLGDPDSQGSQGWNSKELRECSGEQIAGAGGAWSDYELVPCRDGKTRRIESGTFPLADGFPGRVGLLRGYGNAIVPQVAAQFIQAAF